MIGLHGTRAIPARKREKKMNTLRMLIVVGFCMAIVATPSYAARYDDRFGSRGRHGRNVGWGGYGGYGGEHERYHRHKVQNFIDYYKPVVTVEWRHMSDGTVKPYYHSYIPAYQGRFEDQGDTYVPR